jgi:ATP-dependent Clp protease adapter protein ClpS
MPNINASSLPEKPDLAQERKRAKDLLKAFRNHEGDAIARFHSHHPRFADLALDALHAADAKLNDAQWVIAREYGFPSWRSLKAYIEQVSGQAGTAPHTVLMWNDDATPMEFVLYLLKHVFQKSEDEAHEIMLDTHHHGAGVCAVYERLEDAEAKVAEAKALARQHGHPLELTYAFGDAAQRAKPTRPLEKDLGMARAKVVRFDMKDIRVELTDGRTLNVPLAWFPKLLSASADQRRRYALSQEGRVLSWNDLDLTISVSGLLLGPEGQSIVMRMPRPLSVEACRAALTALTREQAPHEWAEAQHDLGNALFRFDVRAGGGDPAPLEEAAAAHRAAVGAFNRARAPFEWAKAQYDFANALLALGARRRDTAIIKEAVAACGAAIEGYGERAPIERAETQRLLGNALVALGAQETGTARFEEAVAVFRLALREHARGPLAEWTNTQHSLGNALIWLGTRDGRPARLEEAVAAFEPVLTDVVRERLPLQWALSAGRQGVALMELAERLGDVRSAQTAAAKFDMAIAATPGEDHKQITAYHEVQLAKARELLDRLSGP